MRDTLAKQHQRCWVYVCFVRVGIQTFSVCCDALGSHRSSRSLSDTHSTRTATGRRGPSQPQPKTPCLRHSQVLVICLGWLRLSDRKLRPATSTMGQHQQAPQTQAGERIAPQQGWWTPENRFHSVPPHATFPCWLFIFKTFDFLQGIHTR